MIKQTIFSIILGSIILLGACKSDFEKIRTNPDPDFLIKKAFEYYEQEDYNKAQSLFELVINSLRGKTEAERVYFSYAYTHYYQEKYVLASYYFKNFVATYGNSPLKEEAEYMSAYSYYKLSPIFRLEQSNTLKAIDGFQLFVNTYPNSERVAECNRLIDEMRVKLEKKEFSIGQLYYDTKQYQSATRVFENMLKDYPDSKNHENIRHLIVKSAYLLAENSVFEKKKERFEAVVDKADEFIKKYPESNKTQEVKNFLTDARNGMKKIDNVGYKNESSRSRS